MTIWQQLVDVARRTTGFVLGAPTRWVQRMHSDTEGGFCLSTAHRRPVEWPCREWMDATDALAEHPSWRS